MLDLNDTAQEIHDWARAQGFYEREIVSEYDMKQQINPSMPSEKVALMHEECSELLRALREDDPQGEAEECADIMIRVLDFCAWRGIDIEHQIKAKMEKNLGRERLHGKKF